jgi:hypothetical protein
MPLNKRIEGTHNDVTERQMNRLYSFIVLCGLSLLINGCSPGTGGMITAFEGEEVQASDFYETGYNALFRHNDLEAGYTANWGILLSQNISVEYQNNGNEPIAIKVADFKMVKNNVAVPIISAESYKKPDTRSTFRDMLSQGDETTNLNSETKIFIIPPKSSRSVSVYFDNWSINGDQWDTKIAPREGDIVFLDIPAGDKVFHIKSRIE